MITTMTRFQRIALALLILLILVVILTSTGLLGDSGKSKSKSTTEAWTAQDKAWLGACGTTRCAPIGDGIPPEQQTCWDDYIYAHYAPSQIVSGAGIPAPSNDGNPEFLAEQACGMPTS